MPLAAVLAVSIISHLCKMAPIDSFTFQFEADSKNLNVVFFFLNEKCILDKLIYTTLVLVWWV